MEAMGETALFSLVQVCDHLVVLSILFSSIFCLPLFLILYFTLQGALMTKGLMDRYLAREKLVDHLKERIETAEMEHNKLKASWEV